MRQKSRGFIDPVSLITIGFTALTLIGVFIFSGAVKNERDIRSKAGGLPADIVQRATVPQVH